MPRALQSASLSFGLVNIPVKLYTAARSKSVSFHLLHAKDGSRIREQIICKEENRPVSRKELVKGFEIKRGQYVEITKAELKAVEAEANRNVQIQEFVPVASVDPVYFAKTYYLGPDKGGEKPYRLLAHAMAQEGRGAIAQFVRRGKEELVMVRAVDHEKLMMHVLYYGDEVRAFDMVSPGKPAGSRELHLATELIHQLATAEWNLSEYRDRYRARVMALIKKKEEGDKVVTPKAGPSGKVIDLMAALKDSLAAQASKKPERGTAPSSGRAKTRRAAPKRRQAA